MSNPFAVLESEEITEKKPVMKQVRSVKRDYPSRGGKKGAALNTMAKTNKREFDRHSGMDRKDSKKKDVAGKGAWGDDKEVPPPLSDNEASSEEIEPLEPTRTLDEFLADKTDKAIKTGVDTVPEARKMVTGNWNNSKTIQKEEDPAMIALMEGKQKAKKQKEKKASDKIYLDIEQKLVVPQEERFSDRGSGRGRRGRGRGGDRGGSRGRGSDRGARGGRARGARGLKLGNESEFPSL